MDTTAIGLLGQQLKEFMVKQFAPPPGTKTSLGFMGTGIAVDPASFLSGSQYNPARVNQWLDIVVDPLGEISPSSDQVEFSPWTATQLLEAIYSQSMCAPTADSDAQHGFAKAKSQAIESLGGATSVNTAPLDWYDPSRLPQWPTCSLTASSATSSSGAVASSSPPPASRLWAWRNMDVANHAFAGEAVRAAPPTTVIPNRALAFAASFSAVASPMASVHLAQLSQTATVQAMQVSRPLLEPRTAISRLPASMISERALAPSQALMVSQAVSTAAKQATSSSVSSNSLSLNLKYRLVALSRAPWWNEFLVSLNDWYIPGCGRASMIEDGDPQKVTGVPIALILTSDVNIQAVWSEADRAAALTNTHFGPWAMNAAQFTSTSNTGEASLQIPGIQAIACIYRHLPAMPPQPDLKMPNAPVTEEILMQASYNPDTAKLLEANNQAQLNWDQWTYYRAKAGHGQITADGFDPQNRGALMPAAEYQRRVSQLGLS